MTTESIDERATVAAGLERLKIFPLPSSVLIPEGHLPFHIFEIRLEFAVATHTFSAFRTVAMLRIIVLAKAGSVAPSTKNASVSATFFDVSAINPVFSAVCFVAPTICVVFPAVCFAASAVCSLESADRFVCSAVCSVDSTRLWATNADGANSITTATPAISPTAKRRRLLPPPETG